MCHYNQCAVGGRCVSGGGSYHHKTYGGAPHAIDGHVCQRTWRATARGRTYQCNTYCCRLSYNTYASYCRVYEYGRQVLKQCRAYTSLSEEADVAVSEDGSGEA